MVTQGLPKRIRTHRPRPRPRTRPQHPASAFTTPPVQEPGRGRFQGRAPALRAWVSQPGERLGRRRPSSRPLRIPRASLVPLQSRGNEGASSARRGPDHFRRSFGASHSARPRATFFLLKPGATPQGPTVTTTWPRSRPAPRLPRRTWRAGPKARMGSDSGTYIFLPSATSSRSSQPQRAARLWRQD